MAVHWIHACNLADTLLQIQIRKHVTYAKICKLSELHLDERHNVPIVELYLRSKAPVMFLSILIWRIV